MKSLPAILFLLLLCAVTLANPKVTVYQSCGQKELIVFYKDGTEGAMGQRINDSCIIYDIPVTEPRDVVIVIGEDTRHLRHVWVAPGYHDRSVTIDHCSGRFILNDTLPFDKDDAAYQRINSDLTDGKISLDSFKTSTVRMLENYVISHPDSFLAANYLCKIKDDFTIDQLAKYRDRVKIHNAQYSDMQAVDTYLQNYKYKGSARVGDSFFEFKSLQANGDSFDSRSINDKVIVMYIWYSGCGHCKKDAEPLGTIYSKYKAQGLEVLDFSLDDKTEEWKKSVSAFKYPGINVSDLVGFSSPVSLHYGVSAFPFIIVFDRSKNIAMVTYGEGEMPIIETRIQELLAKR